MTTKEKSWLRREIKWNHLTLLIGFFLVCLGYLWFARNEDVRITMMFLGISLSSVSLVATIVKRASGINKLNWLIVTGFLIAGTIWSAPRLGEWSIRIYMDQHEEDLNRLVQMMAQQPGEVNVYYMTAYSVDWEYELENTEEWIALRKDLDAESLHKEDDEIRVTLDGYRFSGKGLSYTPDNSYPVNGYDSFYPLGNGWYYSK